MITLLLLNFPALLLAVSISQLYFNYLNFVDKILSVAVFYFFYIVSSELFLGILGLLSAGNLLSINLLFMLALFILVRYKKADFCLTGSFTRLIKNIPFNKWHIFIMSIILGFAFVKLIYNLINPPFGWDSLNYHFTFAVEWLKHKNLDTPLVICDNPCPSYYPLSGSLIYLWFIFPFKNVFLADLGQAPFFILVFLSIFSICRKLKVSKEYSFFAAALMAVTPNYFKQLSIAYVDVMVCAWFLLALNFLISLSKSNYFKDAILFSLSLGMLIGTKTIALSYSFILALFFIHLLFKKNAILNAVYLFAVFLFFVVIAGGFGYIRNFIQTDNPFYPLTLKVFDKVIFAGVMDKTNFTAFSKPGDYSLSKALFHEGLGASALLFVFPSIALLIFMLLKRRKISPSETILLGSFILLYLVYRYTFSLPNTRYLYPMLGIGYVMALYALNNIKFPRKLLRLIVIVCVLASMPEMARRMELVISIGLSLLIFIILSIWYKHLQENMPRLLLIIAVASIIVLGTINANYNKYEFQRYIKTVKYSGFWPDATRAWEWLNKNTYGNNIAYVGRPVPFPLYGTNFKNNVYYVSVNKTEPAKLHYFPDGYYHWDYDFLSLHRSLEAEGNYRGHADYAVWLNNLIKRNTDYLFIYSLHQTKDTIFPMEDGWAKANPGKFSPVFTNETIHIYKINR